jgi:hypothetical protein
LIEPLQVSGGRYVRHRARPKARKLSNRSFQQFITEFFTQRSISTSSLVEGFGDLVAEASPPASFDGAAVTLVLTHQVLSQKSRIDLVVTSAFLSLSALGVQRDNFLPGPRGCDVRPYGGGDRSAPPDQEDEHVCSKVPATKALLRWLGINGADAVDDAVQRRSSVPQDSSQLRQQRT